MKDAPTDPITVLVEAALREAAGLYYVSGNDTQRRHAVKMGVEAAKRVPSIPPEPQNPGKVP